MASRDWATAAWRTEVAIVNDIPASVRAVSFLQRLTRVCMSRWVTKLLAGNFPCRGGCPGLARFWLGRGLSADKSGYQHNLPVCPRLHHCLMRARRILQRKLLPYYRTQRSIFQAGNQGGLNGGKV